MATRHKPIEYKGKSIEFPFENPAEEIIDDEVLHENLARPTTERTKRLKARCRWKHTAAGEFVEDSVRAGMERMRYWTEGHKASDGNKEVLRRAICLQTLLDKCTIVVQEDEKIIGYHAEDPNQVCLYPELSFLATQDYIQNPRYSPQPQEEAQEINNYWMKHSLLSKCMPYFEPYELGQMFQVSSMEAPGFATGYNSIVPPYETVVEDGLLKRIEMAQENIAKTKAELAAPHWNAPERLPLLEKIDVWNAMIQADKAVISWARRHGRLCKIIAENFETDPKRREELLEMADISQRIPAEPCQGLWDVMQMKWYVFLICQALERYATGYAQKEDKLCWPYL